MSAERSNTGPQYSLIVPCFNEVEAIALTVAELRATLGSADGYELIIVNDGSSDGTSEVLTQLETEDGRLRVLHHTWNRGYGAALKTGIANAKTEWIVITDADRTYPNERIPDLVNLAHNVDMVVGARIGTNVTYSRIRMIPKIFLKRYACWIAGQDIPDINSGLRVFRRSLALKYLNILPNSFSFTLTITLALTTNYHSVIYVPIDYSERVGHSKIRPIRDTLKFLQLILRTGTYFAPLRVFFPFIMILGIAFVISLLYDVFVLKDLTETTMLFLLFAMNTGMFALLADMIDKRTNR